MNTINIEGDEYKQADEGNYVDKSMARYKARR